MNSQEHLIVSEMQRALWAAVRELVRVGGSESVVNQCRTALEESGVGLAKAETLEYSLLGRGIPANQMLLCPRCGGTKPTCCSCVTDARAGELVG